LGDFSCCLSNKYLIFEFWGIFGFFLLIHFLVVENRDIDASSVNFDQSTFDDPRQIFGTSLSREEFYHCLYSKSTSSIGNKNPWMTRWKGWYFLDTTLPSHERLECPRNLLFCLPLKRLDDEDLSSLFFVRLLFLTLPFLDIFFCKNVALLFL